MKIKLILFACISIVILCADNAELLFQTRIDSLETTIAASSGIDRIATMIELANILQNEDEQKSAELCFEAKELSQQLEYHNGEINAMKILSNINLSSGFINKGIQLRVEILELNLARDKTENIHMDYYNLGNLYSYTKEYDKSIENLSKCYNILKEIENKDQLINTLFTMARVYRFQSKFPEALSALKEAELLSENFESNIPLSGIFTNIGDIYEVSGDFDKAEEYYQRALTYIKQNNIDRRRAMLYVNLANIHKYKGEYFSCRKR